MEIQTCPFSQIQKSQTFFIMLKVVISEINGVKRGSFDFSKNRECRYFKQKLLVLEKSYMEGLHYYTLLVS